jgi:hypothetical protein
LIHLPSVDSLLLYMSAEKKLAFLNAHLNGMSCASLQYLWRDIRTENRKKLAEAWTKGKRGERKTSWPVILAPMYPCPGGKTSISQKKIEPETLPLWGNSKPTNSTRPFRMVQCKLPLDAQRRANCPHPSSRLCLCRQRGTPAPKARWQNPLIAKTVNP